MESAGLAILGGGPAGLSVAYFAEKHRLRFALYEANRQPGGNCVTFQQGPFLFDSGAHRFHDKDPAVTKEIKELLGSDLLASSARSQIFFHGKFVDFPLSPLNLLKSMGPFRFFKAGTEVILSRLQPLDENPTFEDFAVRNYGRTVSSDFLLNYSRKLWGLSASQLSPVIAGTRMKGLNLKTFLTEAFKGKEAKVKHLDGSFYYPRFGIGMITQKLAGFCKGKIFTDSRITKLVHRNNRFEAIEINGETLVPVDRIVSTLPLSLMIHLMDPAPPADVLEVAKGLRFRNLVLVGLFLNRGQVTQAATLYFPEERFPFTRVYEPKIRSEEMSPPDKTSLISEVPCSKDELIWKSTDQEIVEAIFSDLSEVLGIQRSDIIDTTVIRIPNAYPILEWGFERRLENVLSYLKKFENLLIAGRNGMFNYTSIHNMIRSGKDLIEELVPGFGRTETV